MKPTDYLNAGARWLGLGCATLLLASCASDKGIHTQGQLRSAADFSSSASLAPQGGSWPEASWPARIGGAPLQALVDEALADNPSLDIAAARIGSAQSLSMAARAESGLGSYASFNSTYQRYSENGILPPPLAGSYHSDNQLALNFSYNLDFWGRHEAQLLSGLSQEKMAEAQRQAARLTLATAVARTWIQLGRERAQLDLVARQLEIRQKILELAQLRVRAGLDPENDSEQARQQLASLRSEQAQWQEAVALTRNQMAALLGKGPDRGRDLALPELPPAAAAALPDNLGLDLLGRRPDIVAARWQVEAMQGDIDAARAQFYPNINLAGYAGLSSLGLSNLLQAGSRVVGIGPAIRVPLFESGSLRAQLKGRVAAYDNAVATYNQALNDAVHEVADQVQSLRGVAAQDSQLAQASAAAAASLRLARQREQAGTASTLPVLAAESVLLAQRRAELESQARRADLEIGLIKALGGGFDASATGLAPAADPQSLTKNPSAFVKNNS